MPLRSRLVGAGGTSHGGDRHLLGAHLLDTKDARGHIARWTHSTAQMTMQFDVYRGDVRLWVRARFHRADEQQYWLHHPDWRGGHDPLARLCVTRRHDADPHWHYFDGPGEPRDTRGVQLSEDADLSDPGYLLTQVFIPHLRIVELIYEGGLL